MGLPIFFMDTLADSDLMALDLDTSKHVIQVLRMKRKELLRLTDGKGSLLTAEIVEEDKRNCTVRIINKEFKKQSSTKISIAIALLKNAKRFEWFLEKATEIGVAEIIPVISERTEKQHFRFDRMQQILIAAMLQSQQVWLPVLNQPTAFEKIIGESKYLQKLIAHCVDTERKSLRQVSNDTSTQILIGPEGDFTDDEIAAAMQANYAPVILGPTRLRTETAGIVAATLLCV